MKQLNNFIVEHLKYSTFSINEKLRISPKTRVYCYPKDKFELRKILEERLAKNKNADLNDIDVSQITDMGRDGFKYNNGLFEDLDPHNIDISLWNVSNVRSMNDMFLNCKNFTGKGLENWNVSNVENMLSMFNGCSNFNCDLSNWDVSKVTDMSYMFLYCRNFTGKGLENWNVSNVVNMRYMFANCEIFNCDLGNWNVTNVKTMNWMFYDCKSLKNKPTWYKE